MKSIFLAIVLSAFFVSPSIGVVYAGSGDSPVTIGLPSPPLDEEAEDGETDDDDESGDADESGTSDSSDGASQEEAPEGY